MIFLKKNKNTTKQHNDHNYQPMFVNSSTNIEDDDEEIIKLDD